VHHEQDSWDYYSKVRKHVVYVHIKDGNRGADGHTRFCYPGKGAGAVQRILKNLINSGYTGGLSIEPHIAAMVQEAKQSSPEDAYRTYVEYGRRLMRLVEEERQRP